MLHGCLYRDLMLRTSRLLRSIFFCDSYEWCFFCVCVCARAILNTILSSWTIPSHVLRISNAHAPHIKQRYNIIIEPHVGSCTRNHLCSPNATCDTPGISSLPHPEGEPCITMYQIVFFAHGNFLLFRPRVCLVLWIAGLEGGPREHCGASVGHGRGPWHVLWGVKVAKTGK